MGAESQLSDEQLPPGWSRRVSKKADEGKIYYCHPEIGSIWESDLPDDSEKAVEKLKYALKLTILAKLRSQNFRGNVEDIDLRDSPRGRRCSYTGCEAHLGENATKSEKYVRCFERTHHSWMDAKHGGRYTFAQRNFCCPRHKRKFMENREKFQVGGKLYEVPV